MCALFLNYCAYMYTYVSKPVPRRSIKPFALLLSSFEEAALLDADVTFFLNPDRLFDDPDYRDSGALFYLDRRISKSRIGSRKWIESLLPESKSFWAHETQQNRILLGTSLHQQDSGVVVVNKVKNLDGLLGTCLLLDGDRRADTFKWTHGDKEAFW
jgi:alpha 1,3-mannosyltransferase